MTSTDTIAEVDQRETEWLLKDIHEEISGSISTGLEECLARLCERAPFKLVMSSAHSELLKGIVTRTGSCIAESDLVVRSASMHNKPIAIKLKQPLYLSQIVDSLGCISDAVQIITSLECAVQSANNTLLHLQNLQRLVKNALANLRKPSPRLKFPGHVTNTSLFDSLPSTVAVDFYVSDNSVVVEVHIFEPLEKANSGIHSLFKKSGKELKYDGNDVLDYEKVVVESQDPNLISVTAKLTALEAHLQQLNRNLTLCQSVST